MAWSTRSKLFFLHSNSVAQNSLISEFRASNVRRVCLFKNTVPITFFSHNDSSPASTPYLRFPLKTSSQRAFSHFTFLQKKLKFYKPRKNCGFYNHSIGESQPMWITDSRVKPVESVWSLVGIETRGSIRCPNAVVIKLIRKDWKWFVKQNASFIFNQKRRYAIERCPCNAGASFYCLFNSFTRSIILKSCEQITVLPLISGRAKLLKIIL